MVNEILKVLERDASIHKAEVYVPVNRQILMQTIDILKGIILKDIAEKEPEKLTKTPAKRTRKTAK
jgi:hypothetical protein